MEGKVNIGQIQMHVTADKKQNVMRGMNQIKRLAEEGAQVVVLPEMFCCPYQTSLFSEYAEKEGEETFQMLSEGARENEVYLIGGSVPEISEDGKIFNTSYVFDRSGRKIGKHRKMRLFNIDIKNGQRFREADTLSAGEQITVIDTDYGKIGVMICFDVRFPELARDMALEGANIIFVPGAFNMTTGPSHWEVLFRARAVDNQIFMVGTAPAKDEESPYISYGNSIVVSPWGDVISKMGFGEESKITTIDLNDVYETRQKMQIIDWEKAETTSK